MASLQQYSTERLRLVPTDLVDAPFLLELMNSPKWLKYIGDRGISTIKDAEAYITNTMIAQRLKLGFATFTLVRKNDGVKVGTCGLYEREGLDEKDLGYALLPQFEGKGYALEAAKEICTLAKSSFCLTKLQAITTEANLASQHLLKKLSFVQTGTIRLPNDETQLLLFTLEL